jgi:hypothetical protein
VPPSLDSRRVGGRISVAVPCVSAGRALAERQATNRAYRIGYIPTARLSRPGTAERGTASHTSPSVLHRSFVGAAARRQNITGPGLVARKTRSAGSNRAGVRVSSGGNVAASLVLDIHVPARGVSTKTQLRSSSRDASRHRGWTAEFLAGSSLPGRRLLGGESDHRRGSPPIAELASLDQRTGERRGRAP